MKKFDVNYNEKSLAVQGFHAIFSLIYPAKLGFAATADADSGNDEWRRGTDRLVLAKAGQLC